MHRFFDAANAVTLAGLGAALGCALLAASGRPAYAVVALIAAGICDLLDGAVARRLERTEEARRFGAKLDTVVDACAFGMAPAVLLYGVGLRSPAELAVLFSLAAAALWRLAYFDTVGFAEENGRRAYTGLPTTYVALVLPVALLFGFAGETPLRLAAIAAAVLLAVGMVSPLRNRKLGGAWYGVFVLLAIAMVAIYLAGADRYPAPPL